MGIASKETVDAGASCPSAGSGQAKAFGNTRLDEITTEHVQRLKAALTERAPKTVNNILPTLGVVLRTAIERGVIARVPCAIKLLKAPKGEVGFYDFDEFERLSPSSRLKRPRDY